MKICTVIPNYNHMKQAAKCLDSLLSQSIGTDFHHSIVFVDDGSTDGSADIIESAYGDRIALIYSGTNQGRSAARNMGASISESDYIVFIDSDCIADDPGFIHAYIESIRNGKSLIFGPLKARGDSFWDRMQRKAFQERDANFESGNGWSYSTSNFCIKKSLFDQVGGFDQSFDRYGFEDRDLFIRLIKIGTTPSFQPRARVIHDDTLSLDSVCEKMLSAGMHGARLFRNKHPEEYGLMPYSKLDCELHPWLRIVDRLTWPIISRFKGPDPSWLEFNAIPLSLRIAAVRLIYGLHYLHGTRLSKTIETPESKN
jgi:GT2 family glycosyltransferase